VKGKEGGSVSSTQTAQAIRKGKGKKMKILLKGTQSFGVY